MLHKKKIILHTLDAESWKNIYEAYPMQRGILFAEEGDVVISPTPFEKDYLEYLKKLGILPESLIIWHPKEPLQAPYSSFLASDELKNFLRPLAKTHYLDVFLPGRIEEVLARELGLEVFYNFRTARTFNDKSNFRKLLKSLGIPTVRGFEYLKTPNEIRDAVFELFSQGATRVIVKRSAGLGGSSNLILDRQYVGSFDKTSQTVFFKFIYDKLNGQNSSFIVEEFLERESSPGFKYIVHPDGSYNFISASNQIFITSGHLYKQELYNGGEYTVECEKIALTSFALQLGRIMDTLAKQYGYFGHCGFDGILDLTHSNKYIVDSNLSLNISIYPHVVAKKILLPEQPYINSYYLLPYSWFDSFSKVYKLLGDIAFPIKNKERGAVILSAYRYDYDESYFRISILFTDNDYEKVLALKNTFESNLDRFLDSLV